MEDEFMGLIASALVQSCNGDARHAELLLRRRVPLATTTTTQVHFTVLADYIFRLTACGHVWGPVV